jgi:hypothetical protein
VAAFGEGIFAKMKPAFFILAQILRPPEREDMAEGRGAAPLFPARHADQRFQKKSLPCA